MSISTDNLIWLFEINDQVLKVNTVGFTNDEALRNPTPGGNCATWIVGHILRSRQFLLKLANQDWALPADLDPIFKRGSKGNEIDRYPAFDELIKLWDDAHQRLSESLPALTVEQMAEEVAPFGDFSRADTRDRRFLFLHFHESYHVGQIGLIRRLLGKDGAIQ